MKAFVKKHIIYILMGMLLSSILIGMCIREEAQALLLPSRSADLSVSVPAAHETEEQAEKSDESESVAAADPQTPAPDTKATTPKDKTTSGAKSSGSVSEKKETSQKVQQPKETSQKETPKADDAVPVTEPEPVPVMELSEVNTPEDLERYLNINFAIVQLDGKEYAVLYTFQDDILTAVSESAPNKMADRVRLDKVVYAVTADSFESSVLYPNRQVRLRILLDGMLTSDIMLG